MREKKQEIQLSDHFTYPRLLRFVLPSIVMMVFTSIYGVVDGLFVSNFVGKTPFAAINLIMPFLMLFGGVGFLFGTGGSALVAMTLGEGKQEQANRYFSMIVIVTALVGGVISALEIIFIKPVALFLGADEEMLPHCMVYGILMAIFNVAFMLQNVFQSFCVTAEKPKLGLIATVGAGITNMVLDALFIAVFRWGVVGAAMATALSECVGMLIPMCYFLSKKNSGLLHLTKTRLELKPILRTASNGASEMVSNITGSVVAMLYNYQLLRYAGENGIAAYGVLMYVGFAFAAIFIGYSIGSAPVVSYHYGAANHSELKNMLKKSAVLMFGAGGCMFLAAELLARPLARLFVGYDAALTELTVSCFRISVTVYLVAGFNIFASSFFTALNNGAVSAAISFLRTFVFKMSAVLLLPMLFGLNGIWWAEVVAEIVAFMISVIFLIAKRRKYHYWE